MKLSSAKVDSSAIEAGDWVRKIPQMGDLGLKVMGFGSTEDLQVQKDFIEALPMDQRAELSAATERDLNTERILAALQDWENVVGDDNLPIPFSKAFAREVLTNRDFMPFRDAVWFACGVVGKRRGATEEIAAKN